MYNNDYIIAVDENGSPYIAHAYATDGKGSNTRRGFKNAFSGFKVKWGSNTGNTPKYKEKIPLGNGKFRYVYEEAKKAAKKAWGSKAGRWIDEHDAGISERLMARRASRKAKQSAKSGDRDATKYYARRSRELNQESARENKAAKESIRRRTEPIRSKAKDVLGYDEQERFEQARKRYNDLQKTARQYPDSVSAAELERRRQDMLDAQKAYTRTAKGALEYLNAKRKVRKSTRK